MPWVSLAATRHDLRATLRQSLDDPAYQETKLAVVDAAEGRDALLVGDEAYVEAEIERAEALLEEHEKSKKPPHPAVMSEVLSLAVTASAGGNDHTRLLRRIAEAKVYKEDWLKSLQQIARRIVGIESAPTKPYEKRGHVEKEEQWYRLVREAPTAHAYNLAVTPDHPGWYVLCRYVLPLAFLLRSEQGKEGDASHLRRLLRWGGPDPDRGGDVVYERTAPAPKGEATPTPGDRATWRGFDAVEIRGQELFAYYYLGIARKGDLTFDDAANAFGFLDGVAPDWQLVQESLPAARWGQIEPLRDQGRCTYVVVYDAGSASAPERELERAAQHYGLKLLARDITEV